MRYLICFLLVAFAVPTTHAQRYIPIDTANLDFRTIESKEYVRNSKLYYDFAKDKYKSGERRLFKKRCENLNKLISEDILSGQYIFDLRFQKMLDSILIEIVSNNPEIPNDLKFYIARNNTLNAASIGNKCFTVNLGTFYFSQNEDQLAATVCHEIAHYLLDHVLQDIQREYSQKKELDGREEVEVIKTTSNNWGDKAYNRLKELLYKQGDLNKKQEYEADSMGYVLFRNTHFKKADYLNSFRLKEVYDTIRPIGLNLETYKKVFNLPLQPFKPEWMKKEDFSKYDYSKFKSKYNEDSLSSHPETELRIKALLKWFPEMTTAAEPAKPSITYEQLADIAKLEQPCTFEIQEEYGLGAYFCLYRIQDDDRADYYKERLGIFFRKIYEARKEYRLNRYVDRVDPKNQSESYQQFLNFIWNLNLSEIRNIADYYTTKGS